MTFTVGAAPQVQRVSAGADHSCAIGSNGITYCAGSNGAGQLGDGTTTNRSIPVAVAGPPGVVFMQVATGGAHTCAVSAAGAAYCWGRNDSGQLGDGTTTQRLGPVAVVAPVGTTFIQVAASQLYSCGVTAAGAIYCWGDNQNGQLGDGTTTQRSTPVAVAAPEGASFVQVTTGAIGFHTCGVTVEGAAYCWGFNGNGQLGDGTTATRRLTPVGVAAPGGVRFSQVAAGQDHSCGVTAAGVVYCWGANGNGQLGDGTSATRRRTPVAVVAPAAVSFAQVVTGKAHSCGVTGSGAAYCWGANPDGVLGDGTTLQRTTPVAVVSPAGVTFSQLATGLSHTCGMTPTAATYCWGSNLFGRLGDGTTTERSTPVAVAVPAGVTFMRVAMGSSLACGLTPAGSAYCWGEGGLVGDGTSVRRTTPVAVATPAEVTLSQVTTGGSHSCGLTVAGVAYCWGSNLSGQIGDGTTTQRLTPVAVAAPAGVAFTQVATGPNGLHTCGVTVEGAAYCWGFNGNGQLGDGTTTQRLTPVAVAAPAGVTFTQVAMGSEHSCGLTVTRTAYCWGRNDFGQLGDGSFVGRIVPVAVAAPPGVMITQLTAGIQHTCGITAAGPAYCWGSNSEGQLGNGTRSARSVPVAVSAPVGVTFTELAAGGLLTCGRTTAAETYCWGANELGQLGDGTVTRRLTPVAVATPVGVTFTHVASGGWRSCGVTAAGAAYCWGDGSGGLLGDGYDNPLIRRFQLP
ncbi:MAG: hypothetical protein NW201_09165 [Gemmatimonadales bacterium]|nr:hypothetical protein [Gemmatimonadales bacterium]